MKVEPLIKIRTNILLSHPVRILIRPGNPLHQREIMWTSLGKDLYDQIGEQIEQIKQDMMGEQHATHD